jgi:hypothetical protein
MAFRSSSAALGPSAGSVVLTAPAGLALGDMIIIAVIDSSDTVVFPSGFTAFPTPYTTSGSHSRSEQWNYAWKVATGSEPGTYTVSVTGFGAAVPGVIGAWSGRSSTPGSPVITDEAGGANSGGTFVSTLTGYTAAAGDDICVLLGVAAINTGGTWATTTSSGCTVVQDQNGAFGAFTSSDTGLAFNNSLSAGATGTFAFTETLSAGTGTLSGDGAGVIIPLPSGIISNTASIAWVS